MNTTITTHWTDGAQEIWTGWNSTADDRIVRWVKFRAWTGGELRLLWSGGSAKEQNEYARGLKRECERPRPIFCGGAA